MINAFFGWLVVLPWEAQVVIFIIMILSAVVISIWGTAAVKWGATTVGFGGKNKTTGRPKLSKRSCGDCVVIMMGTKDTCSLKIEQINKSILKNQMNIAEQKLIELQNLILQTYRTDLEKLRPSQSSVAEEMKQFKLYQSVLSVSLTILKDDIRRCFKENGFEELDDSELKSYTKEKSKTLKTICLNHMSNQYPYEGMIVPWDNCVERTDELDKVIENIFSDMFIKAKELKLEANKNIKEITNDFKKEIDNLIK